MVTWPGAPLTAIDGEQSCHITENLENIDVGKCDFYCCWSDNKNNRFGVKIIAYTQVLGLGNRPAWQIMYDQSPHNSNITWKDNGSSAGDQYCWPDSVHYDIVATPTSNHQSLSINVTVRDSNKTT